MALGTRFADLLEYPGDELLSRLDACIAELSRTGADASGLAGFRSEAERLGPARLEEAYTAAFDLDPACALYAGHHLFGENSRRGPFLSRLAAEYRSFGFAPAGGEPPDHLPLMLRYADTDPADPIRQELLAEIVLPAVRRVGGALAGRAHPYAPVLQALAASLEARRGAAPQAPGGEAPS